MDESKSATAVVKIGTAHSIGGRVANQAAWGDLIARVRSRDQLALAALYDQSSSIVYSMALRIVGNSQDAEEVTMDVFKQVWRSAPEFDPARGSVLAWIVTLARTRAIDRQRRTVTRTRIEQPLEDRAPLRTSDPGPEEQSVTGQLRNRLRLALEALSEEQRVAIELAFFSGYTHSELSHRLGAPVGTVKTRIRQGLLKLRRALGDTEGVHLV